MNRYDAARRRQARPGRSALGYWVPLVVTVTIATAGLAAWIWSERQQDDDDNDDNDQRNGLEDDKYDHPLDYPEDLSDQQAEPRDEGFLARMTGRTPSPQQFFDRTGQRIRAAVGLSGDGRQEERAEPAFSDSEHWNEEAESKRSQQPTCSRPIGNKAKRNIAIVLSADTDNQQDDEASYRTEHASILSHLPEHIDPAFTNLFILIYAPDQKSLPALPTTSASTTLSSSYASVSYPGTSSPDQPSSSLFDALWQKSQSLVDKPSQVLPFSTPTGYIHILRHLSPSLVYLTDAPSLSGQRGEHIQQLKGWVGQTILVVGDDGAGGLVDTETETEDEALHKGKAPERSDKWWGSSELVGLGKDVEVVDIGRMGDDWWRRVGNSN
ncbi:hypothetical protein M438DRAFT_376740 [Aureobasidium pullulans EXF-150]|uniref:Peroxin 22-like protein n=1 Tax=Aureobasidium pullulans EXF-150 TaxID=1043002 RepID=A0A074XCR9_AURPU|nr:uncharacterized protein M438DRAFT_376740 [Aureobasidium pullulans EXF-150]KEQ81519.1 hypothetical protein M438DRAFT_376740 [Aureobasidium pullulans EXF-150]